jgi:outer membrane protein TolC
MTEKEIFIEKFYIMRIFLKYFIFFANIIFINFSLTAQNKITILTLNQVITLAQEQSPDAMNAKHQFLSNYWAYRSYKANYLPAVTLSLSMPMTQGVRKIETLEGPQYVSYANNSYSSNIKVTQRIGFTGGNISLVSSLERNDNIRADITTTSYSTIPFQISYSQPLFKFNSFKWERRKEPLKYEKAKKNYIETVENISIIATNFFFNLLKAKINKEISEKNYADYEKLLKVAKGRFKLGKIAKSELLQVELSSINAEKSINDVRLDYKRKIRKFKSFLRLNPKDSILLIPPKRTLKFKVDISKAYTYAKENTSKALEMKLKDIERAMSLEQLKMERRPEINLSANYGLNNTANKFSEIYKNPEISKGFSFTVSAPIPIIDWGRRKGRRQLAESSYRIIKAEQEQERIDFEEEIMSKIISYSSLEKQLLIAAKSDTIAKESYELTQKRYLIGKITDIQKLKEAQIAYDKAKVDYLTSIQDYWIGYFELRKLTLYDFHKNEFINVDFNEVLKK